MTSSMAYSSARRLGYSRVIGVPKQQILAFLVCGISAAAMMLQDGIMLYTVLWCSFTTSAS